MRYSKGLERVGGDVEIDSYVANLGAVETYLNGVRTAIKKEKKYVEWFQSQGHSVKD